MRYLIDTHVLLWSMLELGRLTDKVQGILGNRADEIFVSSISLWEISVKYGLGKLELEKVIIDQIPRYIEKIGYELIDMNSFEAIGYYKLGKNERHKDPFDRMLIWQAINRNMILISKDVRMKEYEKEGLRHLW